MPQRGRINPRRKWFERRFSVPSDLPIFKEAEPYVSDVALVFHSDLMYSARDFQITTVVQTPGYSATEHWTLRLEGNLLRLLEPGVTL